jgi:hypothetical protein
MSLAALAANAADWASIALAHTADSTWAIKRSEGESRTILKKIDM